MCQHCSKPSPLGTSTFGAALGAPAAAAEPERQDEKAQSQAHAPGMLARLYARCEGRAPAA
jgi:hypothetical protein